MRPTDPESFCGVSLQPRSHLLRRRSFDVWSLLAAKVWHRVTFDSFRFSMLSFSAVVHRFYLVVSRFFSVYTWKIHRCKIIGRNPKEKYNSRRCLKYRRFQFFSQIQFSHFGLDFFRSFVGFFRRFVGFFPRFKTSKHMQKQQITNIAREQKQLLPAIIPQTAIILHTLEDAGMFHFLSFSLFFCLLGRPLVGAQKCLEPWSGL